MKRFVEWLMAIFSKSRGASLKTSADDPAPWMSWMKKYEGKSEWDLDKEFGRRWALAGLPHYSSIIGSRNAWCALTINLALHDSGYVGNKRPDAASFRTFGEKCEYKFGAIIPIRHASGANHVTFFHHWIDENAKIAACLGGNQDNKLQISTYNLSGNKKGHDECVGGPRWPVRKLII